MKKLCVILLAALMLVAAIPVQAGSDDVGLSLPVNEEEPELVTDVIEYDYSAAPLLLYAGAARKYSHPETEMQKALAYVDGVTDPLEIAVMLHDYLIREIDYDLRVWNNGPEPEVSHWSQGALTTGIAVCQGYCDTYCELLTRKGIECVRVQSSVMGHEWVKIKMNGSWYNVDVTYDDPVPTSHENISDIARGGFASHKLFLKSDAEFLALDHHDQNATDQMTGKANPAANASGDAFAGYAFYPENGYYTGMLNRIGGTFYYLKYANNTYKSSTLVKSALNGSGKVEYTLDHSYGFLLSANGKLYANTDRYVYELNLDGTVKRCVAAVDGELLNFWYKNGSFGVWVLGSDGTLSESTIDVSKTVSNLITDENGFVYLPRSDGKLTLIEAPDVDAAAIPGTVNGKTVAAIAPKVFFKHKQLTALSIGEGIEVIGDSAFWNCPMLQKVYFPKSLKSLGDEAFLYSGNLGDVYFEGNVPADWGTNVFSAEDASSLRIHYSSDASGWSKPTWTDPDGCVYNAMSSYAPGSIHREDMCGDNAYWKYEDGTLTIYGKGAMTNYTLKDNQSTAPWTNLTVDKIVISDGITTVGQCAFTYNYNLVIVELPDTLTSIGMYAFYNCYMLAAAEVPANVTTLGQGAFGACDSMSKLYFKGNAPTSVGANLINGGVSGNTTVISYVSGKTGWSKPTWSQYNYPTTVTSTSGQTGKLYIKKVGTDKIPVNVFVFKKSATQPLTGYQLPEDSMVIPEALAYGSYRVEIQSGNMTLLEYEAELDGPVVEVDVELYAAGDVNLSGSVTAADLQRLYRYQKEGATGKLRIVDVNRDGAFNANDFKALFNPLAKTGLLVK